MILSAAAATVLVSNFLKQLILVCLAAVWLPVTGVAGTEKGGDFLCLSDGSPLKLEDFPAFLERQFQQNVPVVLYVHGRAKLPVRSSSKRKIERQYGVVCVMFHWESAFPGLSFWDRERPLSMVPDAAARLREVLACIPAKADRRGGRITLLVHSMGSLVLQSVVASGGFPDCRRFENILMTEPDCDAQDHVGWVGLLAGTEQVFITQNRYDAILNKARATRPKGVFSLGLDVDGPKAAQARYLDLTGQVGNNHRLFSLGALESQVCVANTIRGILRGEDGQPAPDCIASQDGSVFRLKHHRDPKHSIFRGHPEDEAPEEEE